MARRYIVAASLLPLACVGFTPAMPAFKFGSWLGQYQLQSRDGVALAYQWNDDNTESLAAAEAAARLADLEAEYWESLGPAEREAEERTAAGTKALTEGRFQDALHDFDRAMELRPGSKLWTRGVALYGLGQYSDAATFLERCALAYATKFEDRPTTELLWAAAARAKLGEPSPYCSQLQGSSSSSGSPDSESDVLNAYVQSAKSETDTEAVAVVVEDKLRALEVAAEDVQAAASAARDQWLKVNTAKAAAVQVEDYAQAAALKTEADNLKIAADAAEARAAKASAAVEEAAAAAAAGGGVEDDPAAVLGKVKGMLVKYPREPNPLLTAAWKLFTGEGNLEDLGAVVERAKAAARTLAGSSPGDDNTSRGDADPLGRVFLGHLYAGLWLDSVSRTSDSPSEAAAAAAHYTAAAQAVQTGSAFGGGYDAGFLEGFAATAAKRTSAAGGDDSGVGEPSWVYPHE